ncbi:restriction endonuclease subunit S [Enterococcus sp.]|uniref:restriction endonuclease subunit S n=1 Tax=Enterococcus sp. TaxID=35783 RepID=UPI0025C5857E|nr:restriction endonuclease subunit S [Enterococcus sp.]
MSDTRTNAPKIRFRGFTEDWEQRKLGELSEKITVGIATSSSLHFSSSNDGVPFIKNQDIKENKVNTKNLEYISRMFDKQNKNKRVKIGDILTARTGYPGLSAVVPEELEGAQTFTTLITRLKSNIATPYFVSAFINSPNGMKQIDGMKAGGAQKNVNAGILKNLVVPVPEINEQFRISIFIRQLDDTITLYQCELDLLKQTKQTYLQKLFPKSGENKPEIRFAGFTKDWEQRKLGELANHRGGTAIEKYFKEDGKYKVISIGSYGLDSKYVDQNIRAVSNKVTDSRVVRTGELTMVLNDKTATGTIIGRSLLIEEDNKYVINQRTEIISPKENFDSNFAYVLLNGPFREKVKRIVQGGTQIYVNYPAVSNLIFKLPDIKEQKKIGLFFKQLDDTIALHQRKLDLLKEMKKSLLQQMFI